MTAQQQLDERTAAAGEAGEEEADEEEEVVVRACAAGEAGVVEVGRDCSVRGSVHHLITTAQLTQTPTYDTRSCDWRHAAYTEWVAVGQTCLEAIVRWLTRSLARWAAGGMEMRCTLIRQE